MDDMKIGTVYYPGSLLKQPKRKGKATRGTKKRPAPKKSPTISADSDEWDSFVSKWDLYAVEPPEFAACIQCLTTIMAEQPSPVMQKLSLGHFPVELSRTLTLRHPWELDPKLETSLPEKTLTRNVKKFATDARTAFLKEIKLLESRPVIPSSLQVFRLYNEWTFQHLFVYPKFKHLRPSTLIPSFYDPIHRSICNLLSRTVNLTTLKLRSFKVTKAMIESLAKLPALHTVKFYSCSLKPNVRQMASSLTSNPPGSMLCDSVRNINFGFNESDSAQWLLLRFFPRLHNVTIGTLHSLEPLDLEETTEIFSILRRAINLEALILEGISQECAVDGLIGTLVELFPLLKHLTLAVFAKKERPDPDLAPPLPGRSVEWPMPTWAYASHFSDFKRLESFSWNNRWDPTHMPKEMQYLEGGYPEWLKCLVPDTPWTDSEGEEEEEDDDEQYGVYHWDEEMNPDVLMFAAYCPTLRTYKLLADRKRPLREYHITRTDSGVKIIGGRLRSEMEDDDDEEPADAIDAENDAYASAIWNIVPNNRNSGD
ncbi:hypothetical protein FRC17_002267 [Serendipita sp. 399]|nr:hypothetical protein FRC17_002267 [Serendipita sp. 399]